MKLLLVEDHAEIGQMLCGFFSAEQYQVAWATDGVTACQLFDSNDFDLVLLDLMIPQRSGWEVMAHIRRHSTLPILILSAKDSDSDKTLGLGLGADDYITKPFSMSEVLARVKANLRRTTQYSAQIQPPEVLRLGEISLDASIYSAKKGDQLLDLTAKEFEILKLLLQNPKRVFTKAQLYSLVWNDAYLGDENAINVHISRLRNKIEDDPRNPRYILTVWGIGYKLGDAL